MTGHTKDWLAVGLPLLALLVIGVAAKANSWSDVLVTAFTVAALAGLVGFSFDPAPGLPLARQGLSHGQELRPLPGAAPQRLGHLRRRTPKISCRAGYNDVISRKAA